MKSDNAGRRPGMERVMGRVIVAVCCAVVLAGCTPNHMVKEAGCPDVREITPPAGKAALVVAEATGFENFDAEDNLSIHIFLDRKFIGTVSSYGYFVATVEPGDHYVVANGENYETVLLNFSAGKTYYLEQERRRGITRTRTRFFLVKADRLFNKLNGKCSRFEPDAKNPVNDLDEDTFAEAVAAYTKKNGNKPVNTPGPGK